MAGANKMTTLTPEVLEFRTKKRKFLTKEQWMEKFRKMNPSTLHENKNEMVANSRLVSTEPEMMLAYNEVLRETPLPPKHRVVSATTPQSVSECHEDATVFVRVPIGRGAFSGARVPQGFE